MQGDVVSWSEEEWSDFGDVAVETSDYQKLCESKFENELVAIPEPVTFYEAAFICDFLSGKIYSVDNDLYDASGLYQKLKNELNLKVSKKNMKGISNFKLIFTTLYIIYMIHSTFILFYSFFC